MSLTSTGSGWGHCAAWSMPGKLHAQAETVLRLDQELGGAVLLAAHSQALGSCVGNFIGAQPLKGVQREEDSRTATLMQPHEDPDYEDIGQAFPSWGQDGRDAVLEPPKPPIPPSGRLAEREAEAGEPGP